MWERIKQNSILLFFLKGGLLYAAWTAFYYLWFSPQTRVDERFITHIINVSGWILETLGYKTFKVLSDEHFDPTDDKTFQLIGIVGGTNNQGVWIGSACNAISLFALFSIFVIAFPGSWKKKFWFIPLGIVVIHCLNILRVCALAMISYYNNDLLAFNHSYTFTIIVYGCIFALWFWWVNRYSKTVA
jgi:exosortase family protein XrtF